MKFKRIQFLIITLFCFTSYTGIEDDIELKISRVDKPLGRVTNYTITYDSIMIGTNCYMCLGYENGEITIVKRKEDIKYKNALNKNDKIGLRDEIKSLFKSPRFEEIYFNSCIIDGLEFNVWVSFNGKKRKTYIQNYYESRVDRLMAIVNRLSPKEYEIVYDKDRLLRGVEECDEFYNIEKN